MPTFRVDGVLFDCDGVLVDSVASVIVSWTAWADRWLPPGAFTGDLPHGVRAADIIRPMIAEAEFDAAFRDLEEEEIRGADGTVAIAGAPDLLAGLTIPWSVVTSGTRPLAAARLAAAGIPHPANIVSAEDVTDGKPDPEPYLRGAELIGVDPARCVVFEDAPSGIRAARAAGVGLVIGVGAESASAEPDVVVPDLTAVSWRDGALHVEERTA